MDHTKLITDIKAEIETAKTALEVAQDHAARVPDLKAEIERLESALKALTAPQTPSGRKRIGEGASKRAKAKAPAVPVGLGSASGLLAPPCAECKGMGTMGTVTRPCMVDGCGAHVCMACIHSHNVRWHPEVA